MNIKEPLYLLFWTGSGPVWGFSVKNWKPFLQINTYFTFFEIVETKWTWWTSLFSDLNRFITSLRYIIPFQLIILVSFEQPLEVFTYYSCLAATEINCPPKTTLFSLLNRFNTTLRQTKPFLLKIPGISEQPVQVLTHSSCLEAKEFNSTRRTILFSVLNRFMVCSWQLNLCSLT